MKNFIFGFLSVCCLSFAVVALPLTSCTQLKDSTQSNSTTNEVSTSFGDFDIL